jgi:hypothetical protein
MTILKIGVVGCTVQAFNERTAKRLLLFAIETAIADHANVDSVEIVSGLSSFGISGLAYELAEEHEWMTAGIACSAATDYDYYSVERVAIVGSKWGDEIGFFLNDVDVIVRVGDGEQAREVASEFKEAGGNVYEFELESGLVTA